MSDEKKRNDEAAELVDEDLRGLSGGVLKSGDVTLKRGVINSTDSSDPAMLTTPEQDEPREYEPDGVEHQDSWREQG